MVVVVRPGSAPSTLGLYFPWCPGRPTSGVGTGRRTRFRFVWLCGAMEGGFGSDFGSSGGGKLDPGLIMEQVKVQIAVANAQELLQRMTDKCFRKCIGKPGGSLDNSEQKCIAMCMDRYMDAWNTVSRAYNSRLQRERANM